MPFYEASLTPVSGAVRDYAKMMKEHPEQVQCILLRDTRATEAVRFPLSLASSRTDAFLQADWASADTGPYLDLPYHKYFFFRVPSDLFAIPTFHLRNLSTSYGPLSDRAQGCFPLLPGATNPLQRHGTTSNPITNTTSGKKKTGRKPKHTAGERWNTTKPPDSFTPRKILLPEVRGLIKAFFWRLWCDLIPRSHRPSESCPFDRREEADWASKGKRWDADFMKAVPLG